MSCIYKSYYEQLTTDLLTAGAFASSLMSFDLTNKSWYQSGGNLIRSYSCNVNDSMHRYTGIPTTAFSVYYSKVNFGSYNLTVFRIQFQVLSVNVGLCVLRSSFFLRWSQQFHSHCFDKSRRFEVAISSSQAKLDKFYSVQFGRAFVYAIPTLSHRSFSWLYFWPSYIQIVSVGQSIEELRQSVFPKPGGCFEYCRVTKRIHSDSEQWQFLRGFEYLLQ